MKKRFAVLKIPGEAYKFPSVNLNLQNDRLITIVPHPINELLTDTSPKPSN